MRIVSLGEYSVCRHYRSFGPMNALGRRGHRIAICESAGAGRPKEYEDPPELAGADVLLGYRMMFDNVRAVQRAIASGTAFVWDTDDDLASLPRDSVTFKSLGTQGVAHCVRGMLQLARMADVVTTTTPQLARKYQRLGAKRTVVIPNYLPREAFRKMKRRRRDGQIVIGWVAGAEHKGDAKRVPVVKALRRILAEHPEVRIESAGVELPLPADRYRHHPWVEMKRLPELLMSWDIGLAPLTDTPFNRARSDVKLKEYGAVGLPWLASPVGPYVGLGSEQGGRLVPNYAWHEALEQLIADHETRTELSSNARAWAETQSIDGAVHMWETVCEEAVRRRARRMAPA